jgi:hypothetical protein
MQEKVDKWLVLAACSYELTATSYQLTSFQRFLRETECQPAVISQQLARSVACRKRLTNGSHSQLAAMSLQLRAISLLLFSVFRVFREKQNASRQLSVSSWQPAIGKVCQTQEKD